MDQPFAQLVSQTGCYTTRCGAVHHQSERQSYIACSVHCVDTARPAVIRAILAAKRFDSVLRAKIECFLYRALTVEQWARVTRVGLDKVVKQYATAVKAKADLRMSDISVLARHYEKEL